MREGDWNREELAKRLGEYVWDIGNGEELVSDGMVTEKSRWKMVWNDGGNLPMDVVKIWRWIVKWKVRHVENEMGERGKEGERKS